MPHDPTHSLLSKQNSGGARTPHTPEFKSSGPCTGLQFRSRRTFKNQCFSETIHTPCAIRVREFNHLGNSPEQKKIKLSTDCVSSAKNECQNTPSPRWLGCFVQNQSREPKCSLGHASGPGFTPTLLLVLISLLCELLLLCRFLPFRNILTTAGSQRAPLEEQMVVSQSKKTNLRSLHAQQE